MADRHPVESAASSSPSPGGLVNARCVLCINSGSSSLKFKLFEVGDPPAVLASGEVERIGGPARLITRDRTGRSDNRPIDAKSHEQAVRVLIGHVESVVGKGLIEAVGHRVVHGGERFTDSCLIDDGTVSGLGEIVSLAPMHLPGALAAIAGFRKFLPETPQVACFDTVFHRNLPAVSRRLPLPRVLRRR